MVVNLDLMDECITENNVGFCGLIYVDVNGAKKPNINGRDLFLFYLDNDGSIYPGAGTKWETHYTGSYGGFSWRSFAPSYCGTPGSSDINLASGDGCAARIMENGWKMDY